MRPQADLDVFDVRGARLYTLRAGVACLLYGEEIQAAGPRAPLRVVDDAHLPPIYDGRALPRQARIAFPFIGKLGDALVAAACVAALCERYPRIRVDFAAVPPAREALRLSHRAGDILDYPFTADSLARYDCLLSFADFQPAGAETRSLAEVFSECLRTPRPATFPAPLPDEVTRRRWERRLDEPPYTAVHPGPDGAPRSMPGPLLNRLLDALAVTGPRVLLVGNNDAGPQCAPPGEVLDLRGRTRSVADLAAVLMRCGLLITGDSFPLHLAGAMGLPSIALFGPTHRAIASDYPSVTPLASGALCSPCHTATGPCPLGQRTCFAWSDDALDPGAILDAACRAGLAAPVSRPSHGASPAER